ncbi:MAG: FAD-dependent oxidoreductase [Kordiimonadaceae bacterium]|nr:FAD-dependent oxidoreductase [Kordiimonadaceae bacterium]
MFDAIVIGAGPAGANAAILLSENGLKTALIDEQRDAGGQVWRAKSESILEASITDAGEQGDALRDRLKSSNVITKFNCRVWHIERLENGHWLLSVVGGVEKKLITKALIIATGAQERVIPVPGWTLPGVFGLAGATAIFKEHMMAPKRRTIVAGNGPLLFYVASETLSLGGRVSAVISINSRTDWLKSLPAMLSNPSLIWQGLKWIFTLNKNRIPIYWQHAVKSVEGENMVDGVTICKVDQNWAPVEGTDQYIHGENLCYGQGLMPAVEATHLAGADHHYDEKLGGWVPTIDQWGRTSVAGLYACGDNAGIYGALAAPIRGSLAAQAVCEDAGINIDRKAEIKKLKVAIKFGLAATALTIPRSGLEALITGETEVCRCEGITRQEIDFEIKTGAQSPNAIKSGTRCGMGPCGGRYCMDSVALITQHRTKKSREEIGLPTARPPLRPVTIDDISDDLDYDDLPIPGVSPL